MRHAAGSALYNSTLLIGGTTPALTEDVRLCRALLLFPLVTRHEDQQSAE
jgi:hypothetical protein